MIRTYLHNMYYLPPGAHFSGVFDYILIHVITVAILVTDMSGFMPIRVCKHWDGSALFSAQLFNLCYTDMRTFYTSH